MCVRVCLARLLDGAAAMDVAVQGNYKSRLGLDQCRHCGAPCPGSAGPTEYKYLITQSFRTQELSGRRQKIIFGRDATDEIRSMEMNGNQLESEMMEHKFPSLPNRAS
jgi:hypothetical protein